MIEHLKKYKSMYIGAGSLPFADRLAENISNIFAWLLSFITIMPEIVRTSFKEILTMLVVGLVIGVVTPANGQDTKQLITEALGDWMKSPKPEFERRQI